MHLRSGFWESGQQRTYFNYNVKSKKSLCDCMVSVFRTNHFNDYILEETDLPDELIRNVTGQVAFEEEFPRVFSV